MVSKLTTKEVVRAEKNMHNRVVSFAFISKGGMGVQMTLSVVLKGSVVMGRLCTTWTSGENIHFNANGRAEAVFQWHLSSHLN